MSLEAATLTLTKLTDEATIAGAVVAVVALLFAARQLSQIAGQVRLAAEANVSSSYGIVAERMQALSDVLARNGGLLYPYFYEGESAPTGGGGAWGGGRRPTAIELDLACEVVADFADAIAEQKRSAKRSDLDWSTWHAYLRYIYQQSPVFRDYLSANTDFYPDYIISLFGHVLDRDERTGEIRGEWAVGEWPGLPCAARKLGAPPRTTVAAFADWLRLPNERGWLGARFGPATEVGGYPWMRAWVIERTRARADGTRPRLAVLVRPTPAETRSADVAFAWMHERAVPSAPVDDCVRSWVVAQLEESSVLRRAKLFRHDGSAWQELGSARLRRRPRAPRERFLAPAVLLRPSRSSPRPTASPPART